MASIKINLRGVREIDASLQSARREISSTKNAIRGTTNFISPKIRGRNNLDNRLGTLARNLEQIENKMRRISAVVTSGVNSYQAVENKALRRAKELTSSSGMKKGSSNSKASIRDLFRGAYQGTKNALLGAIKKLKDFADKNSFVMAGFEIILDVFDVLASVMQVNSLADLATLPWKLLNFFPEVSCDAVAFLTPVLGRFAKMDDKEIDEEIRKLKAVEGFTDFFEYDGKFQISTLSVEENKKAAKITKAIDTFDNGLKSAIGVGKSVKGAFDIGAKLSDLNEVKKGMLVFDPDGKQLTSSVLKEQIKKDIQKEFSPFKSPANKSAVNVWSDINTATKVGQKLVDEDFDSAAIELSKPAKTGKDIGKFIVGVEDIIGGVRDADR